MTVLHVSLDVCLCGRKAQNLKKKSCNIMKTLIIENINIINNKFLIFFYSSVIFELYNGLMP